MRPPNLSLGRRLIHNMFINPDLFIKFQCKYEAYTGIMYELVIGMLTSKA